MGCGILRAMVWTVRVAAALAALAVAASCGGGGDDADGREPPRPAPSVAEPEAGPEPEAGVAARGVRLQRVGTFDSPLFVTSPPDDRARRFVVEQAGRVIVVRRGRRLATPFLDIRGQVTAGGEQGLLSLAFAPDYADSGRFYVYFTDRGGDQRIVEYRRRDAERADRHGPRGNAQNLGSLLGKILRIDPRPAGGRPYRVPADNPFAGRAGARGEIYAYGLRNPWRFSFDRATGDLAIGDVGQGSYEEIDFVRRGKGSGANFGWRPFEGRSRYTPREQAPGHLPPVIVRSHADGNCSITGGVVVRDAALPGLLGRYVWGDYCKGRIESARLSPRRARRVRRTSLRVRSLSSFGEDARGRVYVTSLDGPVYRIVPR